MFAEIGERCYIEPPLHANWGGKHVHFGDRVYANFGLTLVDDTHIYVGDDTMFGPNVTANFTSRISEFPPKLQKRRDKPLRALFFSCEMRFFSKKLLHFTAKYDMILKLSFDAAPTAI